MSGQHRKQRPARRVRVAVLLVPVRLACRRVGAAWTPVAGLWARLVEWARSRFEKRDPFADVELDPRATAPDPVPALTAPVEEPQEPAQEPLTPADALHVLHDQNPALPGAHINWRIYDGAVTGEVDALAADETRQRQIVAEYAAVFASEAEERPDGARLSVFAAGDFANVRFVVAAVLIHDDTMPLPVFEEAAADPTVGDDTLRTQEISQRALAEAGVR